MRVKLPSLILRFGRDERGVFAVFFGLLALVLIATAGAVVDFTYIQEARTRAQTALDAAALALQTRISTDSTTVLKSKAQSIVTSQIADASIAATVNAVTVNTTAGTINLTASVSVPTAFIRMVGISTLSSNLLSEVTQGSKNVEVAVALDITGSMSGTKLTNLQSATNTLIDLVVKTTQTPTYSKMSIIPWSNSVNVGSTYAANVRGPVQGAVNISNVAWSTSNANVSGVTKANPAVVTTSAAHGFSTGDTVYLTNISGMSQVNNKTFTITVLTATTFSLNGIDSRSYSNYSTSNKDKAYKCIATTCEQVVTTSSAHNLAAGEEVYITGVSGPSVNNSDMYSPWTVRSVTSTTSFVLNGATGPGSSAYSSGGTMQCLKLGCLEYKFADANDGTEHVWSPSTCVSDRTTNPYTSDPPSSYYLGYVYAEGGNTCPTATLLPLTSNITTLKSTVTSLSAAGSTAGHIGVAWGWYMVSPNFAYLWPTANQPGSFNASTLIKAVVLMTDGDFNTVYCNGVIAADATSGSGSSSDHISCDSPNGSSESQFLSICANIKAQGIILYTVGFDMAGNTAAATRLTTCATDAQHYFQADTGADLTTAFRQIAQSLNSLRVSK